MKVFPSTLALVAFSSTLLTAADDGVVVFHDPFRGKLREGWTWLREDASSWRLTSEGLELRVLPGNMWGGSNDARNVLVRTLGTTANKPVEVQVRLENRPTEQYEQVDLVWYYDDSNMVKLGLELVDGKLCIVMGREEQDRTRTIAILAIDAFALEMRLAVQGNRITGFFQPAGSTVSQKAGESDLPASGAPKVSLQAYQGPAQVEHWAKLSEFTVRSMEQR